MADLLIRGEQVLTRYGIGPAGVVVEGERIVAVEPYDAVVEAAESLTLEAHEVLIPGLVDTHVHINEPGRTEWEGFATATRAALAGGVTTVIDMPLNSVPPTLDVAALDEKRAAAEGRVHVDVGFWGGAVPQNLGDLRPLHEAGVFGFKSFLSPSGVPEFDHLDFDQLWRAQAEITRLGSMLIVHAEEPGLLAPYDGGRDYAGFLASRPPDAEVAAVWHVVEGLRRHGGHAHILHVSAADSLPLIRRAQIEGLALTAETCPHYLTLAAEDIPDGATTHKCCPPVRGAANRDRLWGALADGTISAVVTDHSPATAELKLAADGDFAAAWGGIAGLEVGLRAVWTEARRREVDLATVVGWMATATADQVDLHRKGRIAAGADADLVVFDPTARSTVRAADLHHKNPVTAYDGVRLDGAVRRVWLRGQAVSADDGRARGRLLRRTGTAPTDGART